MIVFSYALLSSAYIAACPDCLCESRGYPFEKVVNILNDDPVTSVAKIGTCIVKCNK